MKTKKTIGFVLFILGLCFSIGTVILRFEYSEDLMLGIYIGVPMTISGIVLIIMKKDAFILNNRLSSRLTNFIRLVMPIFIVSLNIFLISFILITINQGSIYVVIYLFIFLIIFALASFYCVKLFLSLKNIFLNETYILVKDFIASEEISTNEIIDLKTFIPGFIVLSLKNSSKWGKKIYFTPPISKSFLSFGFTTNDIKLLKQKILDD